MPVSVTYLFYGLDRRPRAGFCALPWERKKKLFKVEQMELFKRWELHLQSKIRFLLKTQWTQGSMFGATAEGWARDAKRGREREKGDDDH